MSDNNEAKKLAPNRAEEFGKDVWNKYVIPPFYDRLNLNENTLKPRIIVGGRGCGKTMLLRYLCFDSVLSEHKKKINSDDLSNIGIYWKIDTRISGLLKERNYEQDKWLSAFEHYAVLVLSLEIVRFLQVLAQRKINNSIQVNLSELSFKFCKDYCLNVSLLSELEEELNSGLRIFKLWISNVHKLEAPIFLPKYFLEDFISQIKVDLTLLSDSNFSIFIDEFENLESFQKPLINTWLKHSAYPLIFNIAMKKGVELGNTMGEEKVVNIHDFRTYDIEDYLSDNITYKYFAAEILVLRLFTKDQPFTKAYYEKLKNPASLNERKSPSYRKILSDYANGIFPSYSYKQIAEYILKTPSLKSKYEEVVDSLEKNIREIFLEVRDFSFADATLVVPFILKRDRNNFNTILQEYKNHVNNKKSKFTNSTDWIKNNLVAAILYVCGHSQKSSPIYSGFDTFCNISHGNIRYLLELCYTSLEKMNEEADSIKNKDIRVECQAEAAKGASYSFLNEIRRLGKRGNSLYRFTYRLGLIFKLAGKNPLLSEPEINHFSIKNYKQGSNLEIDDFLNEAVKWSVIYKAKSNKLKNNSSYEDFDYVLNPVYSPFFNISYRKIRKLEIEKSQMSLIINGSEEEFNYLLGNYQKKWNLTVPLSSLELF